MIGHFTPVLGLLAAVVVALATAVPANANQSLVDYAKAQSFRNDIQKIDPDARYCSFLGFSDTFHDRMRSPDGIQLSREVSDNILGLMEDIASYAGVENEQFPIFSGRVVNAAAIVQKNENAKLDRFIVVHPLFFPYLDRAMRRAGESQLWAPMSVLAHEVGHHLAEHTLRPSNQRYVELQADWYSGYILGKIGSALEATQRVLRRKWSDKGNSPTHPGRWERVAAITDGWRQSKCEAGDQTQCAATLQSALGDKDKQDRTDDNYETTNVAPRLMCQLHGEQIIVGNNNRLYWGLHLNQILKLRHVGKFEATPAATSCPLSFVLDLAEGVPMQYCAAATASHGQLTVYRKGDTGFTSIGHCSSCEHTLCPRDLSGL